METSGMVFNVIPTLLHRASFLVVVVSVIYLWVVYRHLRFKSAETKRINEGDYATIPPYVKLMWIWIKHFALPRGIEASGWRYVRDANIRGWLALSCSFAHYPGISLCSRRVGFIFHLAQPKIITRITSRTRNFRYI